MSPMDDELRTALRHRATTVSPLSDPLTRIEARAQRIHRRRVAAAVAGSSLAVVAAVAITVPVVTAGGSQHRQVSGGGTGPTMRVSAPALVTPSGTAAAGGSPTTSAPAPTSPARFRIGDPTTWGFRGDPALRAATEAAATAAWSTATGAGTTRPTTLLATKDADGDVMLVLAAPMTHGPKPGRTEVGIYVLPAHGRAAVTSLHDQDPTWGAVTAKYDGAAGHHWAAVVGAPTTGQIEYSIDRKHYKPVPTTDGWAVFRRAGDPQLGQPQDFVRVLDGDGNMDHPLYRGAIGRGMTFPDA